MTRPLNESTPWPEPTREQHIKELRQATLASAAAALRSCAKVLEQAAKALEEEEA